MFFILYVQGKTQEALLILNSVAYYVSIDNSVIVHVCTYAVTSDIPLLFHLKCIIIFEHKILRLDKHKKVEKKIKLL